ncbi:hypothetical protein M569_02318, partial [Genlisea aurea]
LQYLLYGPLVVNVLYMNYYYGGGQQSWCFLVLVVLALRALVHQFWSSYSCMLFLNRTRRIDEQGIEYSQIDEEWHWDDFLILQTGIASFLYMSSPPLMDLPFWDWRGIICCVALHVIVSEPLYYWIHRLLHADVLFRRYHWYHHSSKVLHPFTGSHLTLMEHVVICVVVGIPIVGTHLIGFGSMSSTFGYLLCFDFLQCLKHSNVEVFPSRLFDAVPVLKYLVCTPSYHSLHHKEMGSNFCLFLPVYDEIWKTTNPKSWEVQRSISSKRSERIFRSRVPDFVFLAHVVDVMSSLHASFVFRSFNSNPFGIKPFLFLMWPGSYVTMLMIWAKSKTFLFSFYFLRGKLHQTWVVPRYGFHYFLPFAKEGINKQIEDAILKADKLGVKVISLAALNK